MLRQMSLLALVVLPMMGGSLAAKEHRANVVTAKAAVVKALKAQGFTVKDTSPAPAIAGPISSVQSFTCKAGCDPIPPTCTLSCQ